MPTVTAIHWIAGVSGNWTQPLDWVEGVSPGAGDDAFINPGANSLSYTVTISTSVFANSLTLTDSLATVSETVSGSQTLGSE
jgi:hypothetical protein